MSERYVLIYDGDCPFCIKSIDWINKNSPPDLFEFLPCQSEKRKIRFPQISDIQCLSAMQLVLPDNRILSGADAIPVILPHLKKWWILVYIFKIPGLNRLAPYGYRWLAKYRYRISCLIKHNEKN